MAVIVLGRTGGIVRARLSAGLSAPCFEGFNFGLTRMRYFLPLCVGEMMVQRKE